jgi:hypothetical protein
MKNVAAREVNISSKGVLIQIIVLTKPVTIAATTPAPDTLFQKNVKIIAVENCYQFQPTPNLQQYKQVI